MNQLKLYWSNLRSSFWFVPALIVAASIGVALALVEIDSRSSEEGELRLIAIEPTFAGLVAGAFDQIRISATGNVSVMLRMLGAIQTIASKTSRPNRRQTLRAQTQWLAELAERSLEFSHDRERFASRLACVHKALERVPN